MPSRKDNIDIIRGMVLGCGRSTSKWQGRELRGQRGLRQRAFKVRVVIGKRSATFVVYNADVERVQGDRAVAGARAADSGGTIGAGPLTVG